MVWAQGQSFGGASSRLQLNPRTDKFFVILYTSHQTVVFKYSSFLSDM